MQIITTREFRANQKKYFDLAEKETVLVTRKNGKAISINVANDEDVPTKMEFLAIQRGLEDIRLNRTIKIKNITDIWESIL